MFCRLSILAFHLQACLIRTATSFGSKSYRPALSSTASVLVPPSPSHNTLLGTPAFYPTNRHHTNIIHRGIASTSLTMSSNKLPKVDFDKTETVGSTRWMRLETLSYHVPADSSNSDGGESKCLKWDRAVRTTKQSEDSIDAVVILAILKNDPNDPSKDEVVCVKQFRPPVDAYTIELPAGLIDANEDPAVAAAREFTEETGYIGKVIQVLPASYLSPGLTNESASMVKIEVDMSMKQNAKIHNGQLTNTNLEGCEQDRGLEKLLLPRVGLLKALHDLQEKEGVKVFAALYSLALGMSVGESAGAATTSGAN